MCVYLPKFRDAKTGTQATSAVFWTDFTYRGKRVRESTGATLKTFARAYEQQRKRELERAFVGLPTRAASERVQSVADVLKPHLETYGINHRASSLASVRTCCGHLNRLLGGVLLPDLTETAIKQHIQTRLNEGASGRSINYEFGELSRAIGRTWRELWPRVRKMEERHDVGRALSSEEERRLIEAADANRSPNVRTMLRVSLLTGLRAGEMTGMTWGQVDFERRIVTVGRAKTAAGTGRQIPMNEDLFQVLAAHAAWYQQKFGSAKPEYFIFPYGSPYPSDPTRPTVELKTAWGAVRTAAGVECRWHDIRHTVCTKLAEAGTPESTMLAIMGHMSRRMLETYSHVRLQAKREAVEALALGGPSKRGNLEGLPKDSPKVEHAARVN